jgi:hypothetical protein
MRRQCLERKEELYLKIKDMPYFRENNSGKSMPNDALVHLIQDK